MKYSEFEDIISQQRMRKYLLACNNESKRAMTLYRYNLKLSQEMFALISCFEVTLRNRIDKEMKVHFGNDWLRDLVLPGGAFYANPRVDKTYKIIKKAYDGLISAGTYVPIPTPNSYPKWSLAYGNTCSTTCNMACAEGIYSVSSQTNQDQQGLIELTIPGYFLNWITSTTSVTA